MKHLAVSVLVPVHKVGTYIERSVRSLFEQTLDNVEFVFVDDASPDDSIEILERVLEEYPERKSQVRILRHEYNRGVAAARNTGIAALQGEYVLMVDSDDYFESDMLETMYAKAKEKDVDIVFADFYDVRSDARHYISARRGCDDLIDIGAFLLGKQWSFLWNRMIRRSLFTDNNMSCVEGINLGEDHMLALQLYHFAKNYAYIPRAFVHYVRYNPNSYTIVMSDDSVRNQIDIVLFFEQFLRKHGLYERYEKHLLQRKLMTRFSLVSLSPSSLRNERIKVFATETNPLICKRGELNLSARIALWFAAYGFMPVFNAMNWMNQQKKARKRV